MQKNEAPKKQELNTWKYKRDKGAPTCQTLPENQVSTNIRGESGTQPTKVESESRACRTGQEPHAHEPPEVAKLTGREEKQNQPRLANLMAEKARETCKTVYQSQEPGNETAQNRGS